MNWLSRIWSVFAATPNNPSFSLNDANAWDALGVTNASSGVNVNAETALTYSPWWRGINLISSDVAKLAFLVYARDGQGKRQAKEHPAFFLLRRKPNEEQTAFKFRKMLQAHALSRGNGYAFIYRLGDGTPDSIVPLPPEGTYPVKENGRLLYVTTLPSGELRKLNRADVIHVAGLGYDGLCGYSVVDKARESLGLGLGAAKYQSVFFRNNARPSIVLQAPNKIDPKSKEQMAKDWNRMHAGLDNVARTAILDMGLQAKEISFSAKDAELILTRQFEIREIANWLGLPPHKLGDTTRTAYASLEQENQSYLDDSLDQWLVNWEEECWDKLLTEDEKRQDTHTVEFYRPDLIRANLNDRANYYRTALGGRPWLTQNEVRAAENLNPDPDPKADDILEPLNMGGAANEPKPPEPPKQMPKQMPPDDEEAHREILVDAVTRLTKRIGASALKAANKPASFMAFVETINTDHGETAAKILRPVGMLLGTEDIPAWLIEQAKAKYLDVAGKVSMKALAGAIEAANVDLETNLPAAAVAEFMGERA